MNPAIYLTSKHLEPRKDFASYGTLDYVVHERLTDIRKIDKRGRKVKILLVNMFDAEEDGQEYATRAHMMLQMVTGQSPDFPSYHTVSRGDEAGYDMIAFTGKLRSFSEYMAAGTFTKNFGVLVDIIRHTRIPVLGLCAGHQLYGITFTTENVIRYIEPTFPTTRSRLRVSGLKKIMKIRTSNHPLFDGFEKTDQGLHYNHEQWLELNFDTKNFEADYTGKEGNPECTTPDPSKETSGTKQNPSIKILSWHQFPRDNLSTSAEEDLPDTSMIIPTVLEHADVNDLGKHVLTFQCHPEWLDRDPIEQENHTGGLTLLVNALFLLSNPDLYFAEKRKLYLPV
ncbi:hypothetical protein HYU06_06460 [Candidatus Woesearchaeota archaeon]|nr:hypothetical protein [Candidatus Woesearchaeota archaeon]